MTSRRAARDGARERIDLLVVNKADQQLGMISLARSAQTRVVPLSSFTGHEVAVAGDGRTAFVPIYSDAGVGVPGSDGRTIDIVDLPSAAITRTHDVGAAVRPHCAIAGDDGILYVTAELRDEVVLLDQTTMDRVGVIPTGAPESHMLAVSADRSIACTSNVAPGSVSVLDIASRSLRGVVEVARRVNRISLSGDGALAFTADQTTPRMAVIDTRELAVRSWMRLPGIGFGSAVTADGTLVVALRSEDAVAIIDLERGGPARVVTVPAGPQAIVLDDAHRHAYSACHVDNVVVEIDLRAAKVTKVIPTGRNPDGLCWVPAPAAVS